MRKVKNITLCVSPEIYRQTRHLAAEYDSTVSGIVAWLLERLPAALERARFPKGGPKPAREERTANLNCETVTPPLTQALPKACGDPTGPVTAPVQLCSRHQPPEDED